MDLVIDTISVEQMDSGKLAFPSGFVLMGDPCYFEKIKREKITSFIAGNMPYENLENCLLIRLPRHEEVNVETVHVENRVGSWTISAAPKQELQRYTSSITGVSVVAVSAEYLGVDSGQMAAIDAKIFLNHWTFRHYDISHSWRHKKTGKMLIYPVDFENYETPIVAYDGKTMNELKATAEWEEGPYQGAIDWSYNGLSHAHDNVDDIAIVGEAGIVTGTGWGDGCYEVLLTINRNLVTYFSVVFIDPNDVDDDEDEDDEEDNDEAE